MNFHKMPDGVNANKIYDKMLIKIIILKLWEERNKNRKIFIKKDINAKIYFKELWVKSNLKKNKIAILKYLKLDNNSLLF